MLFLSKGQAALRSRRSSIESPCGEESGLDFWRSPSLSSSIQEIRGDLRTPLHLQNREQPGKRSSVFGFRSRSNTATSNASSIRSRPSTMTGPENTSRRSSQDNESSMDSPAGSGRTFFSRGRKHSCEGAPFRPSSALEHIDEREIGRRSSILPRRERHKRVPNEACKTSYLATSPLQVLTVWCTSYREKAYYLGSVQFPASYPHATAAVSRTREDKSKRVDRRVLGCQSLSTPTT